MTNKAAFATWKDRIAPVFDVTRVVHLVETEAGKIISQRQTSVAAEIPNQKVLRLAELEVRTLVCGAISRPLQEMITGCGIQVIPFVAGDLQEVVQAWLCGKLAGSAVYAMPGCRRAGARRIQRTSGMKGREIKLNGNKRGQRGGGQGQGCGGQGRGGQGRSGGPQGAGSGSTAALGNCVCTQCGYREPHERGVPCMQKKCAKCGAVMARQ